MKSIFEKDLSGEMVSPNEPGYDALIDDIFATIKIATEMNTGYRTPEEVHEYTHAAGTGCYRRTVQRRNRRIVLDLAGGKSNLSRGTDHLFLSAHRSLVLSPVQ